MSFFFVTEEERHHTTTTTTGRKHQPEAAGDLEMEENVCFQQRTADVCVVVDKKENKIKIQ